MRRQLLLILLSGSVAFGTASSVSATVGTTPEIESDPSFDPQEIAGTPFRAGDAVVVEANDMNQPIVEASGQTRFSLRLPDGAECPGDSLNDQWRTQSFIVPEAFDPAGLVFGVNDPDGDDNWSLYQVNTNPYVDELLLSNDGPGRPALVPQVPPLSFEVFPAGILPDGSYRIGIACTYFRALAYWWDVEIEVRRDPSDQPAELAWNVKAPADRSATVLSDSPELELSTVLLAVGAVFAVIAIFIVVARSRRVSTKEST